MNAIEEKQIIKKKAAGGIAWTALYNASSRAIGLISSLVLAAILTPREFGVIGAAYLALEGCQRFSNGGVDAYLIYHKKGAKHVEDTAFQLALIVGLSSYGLLFLGAPMIAKFFNDHNVINVIRVMGVWLIIYSAKAVPSAILEKKLAFKARLTPDIIGTVVKVGLTVAFALLGLGVWSIVAGLLISEAITMAMLFSKANWAPKNLLRLDLKTLREMLSYTKSIQLAGILGFIAMNMDYSVVGRFLGTFYLGIYTFAFNIANLPAALITQAVSRVMFPAYSELRRKEDIGEAFLKVTKYIAAVALPMGIGMFYTVPIFLTYTYGNKWALAIPVLQILLVLGVARAIFSGTGEVFKALGRPDVASALTFGLVAITLPSLVLFGKNNLIYVGAIMALMSLCSAAISLRMVLKLTNLPLARFINVLKYLLLNSAALAGLLTFVNYGGFFNLSKIAALGISILSGCLLYSVLTLLLEPESVAEIKAMLRGRLPDARKKATTYAEA